MDIFQDTYFLQNAPVTALKHTDARNNTEDAIGNCVDFINYHGGFTVLMWYYRGEINYKSLIGMATKSNEGQVYSGRMNYHTIKIFPKYANILKKGNQFNT